MRKKWKKRLWPLMFSAVLTAFTIYISLDTFVITRVYSAAEAGTETAQAGSEDADCLAASAFESDESDSSDSQKDRSGMKQSGSRKKHFSGSSDSASSGSSGSSSSGSESSDTGNSGAAAITDTSYSDGDVTITLTEYEQYDTTIYVADVVLSSSGSLQTAFAQNAYGKNVTETTSSIASSHNAILAINGDYYGAQESGYVIRNGVLYRSTAKKGQEDLVIYEDGSFEIICEDDITAEELLDAGAVQVLSFGPGLVTGGEVAVTEDEEVAKAMGSNPRTAIGIIDENHYVFVVSDGRTDESEGLTLYQLAEFMESLGVTEAYNLDGGGSSTMYFNGSVVNNPTTTGKSSKERAVSDIVYISM